MQHAGAGHRDEDDRRRQEGDAGRREGDPGVLGETQVLDAKTSATTVGIVDWKTIAPVMLPIASVSLPWRTQMIELNFSGSSVAIGAMTRASSAGSTPSVVARWLDRVDEEDGADDDQPERGEDLQVDDPQARHGRVVAMGADVEPVEAQRREVRGVDVGVGLEVALDVPGVDADQADRHDPLQPDRLERQEGRPDGDGVGDREVAHVVGEDLRVDAHHVAGRAMPGRPQDRDAGHEHGQGREHERRAQDGPHADRVRRRRPLANRIAMIGINVSGSAVPTAASTDPTAPSASSSLRPNHSMPLVNSSAPSRMMSSATTRMTMSMRSKR